MQERAISAKKASESERSSKFVAATTSINPVESPDQMSVMESKFYSLASCIRDLRAKAKCAANDAEIIQMAVDKKKMVANSKIDDVAHGFRCSLLIDCILISSGEAQSKKAAKHLAFQKAAELLCRPYLKIEKISATLDDYRLVGSVEAFETSSSPVGIVGRQPVKRQFNTSVTKLGQETKANIGCLAKRQKDTFEEKQKRPVAELKQSLAEFVIIERVTGNAVSTLSQSADMCRSELSFEFLDLPDGKSRCKVSLNGIVLADCVGESKVSLKLEAAELALKLLKEKCYTVIYKQLEQADAKNTVQRDTVISDTLQKQMIPESNIGNRLLKKIGWTGGGLGKEGNLGIVEPVSLESVINREGLGLSANKGISKDFPLKISNIIQEYMHSDKQEDLVFSPTFTKEERVIIHQQSRRYQLKNKSYGHDEDRFLVLSRKRTPLELIAHVLANGGETTKYILKPPGSS